MSTADKGTKTIDFWPWRHRSPKLGTPRRPLFVTLDGAGVFPEARPIAASKPPDGGMPWPEFAETIPEIGRLGPE